MIKQVTKVLLVSRFATLALALIVVVASTASGQSTRPIGEIEFFGYKGLDVDAVRAALPVHEGESVSIDARSERRRAIEASVRELLGTGPTDVWFGCCDDRQNWMVFVGLPGATNTPVAYDKAPTGLTRLPPNVAKLFDAIDQARMRAILSGDAGEDDSRGFALAHNAAVREKQMAFRRYALAHESAIVRVLQSASDAKQRVIAAAALGYVNSSRRQIAALVGVSLDPDESVRDEAVRALSVLLGAKSGVGRQIPPDNFIRLLASGIWTDHNKAVGVLWPLSQSRDPDLLARLRAGVLDNLIEMARWRTTGHAMEARFILGRIAGIDEARLQLLVAQGQVHEILDALGSTR
jgi:hypothetical protein